MINKGKKAFEMKLMNDLLVYTLPVRCTFTVELLARKQTKRKDKKINPLSIYA